MGADGCGRPFWRSHAHLAALSQADIEVIVKPCASGFSQQIRCVRMRSLRSQSRRTSTRFFVEELRAIAERRIACGARPLALSNIDHLSGFALKRAAFGFKLIGLALSGGGIRSAAFNLGVLQALAHRDVLPRVDYLSTVSGGGYIGSCLTSLISGLGQRLTRDSFPLPRFDPRDTSRESDVLRHIRKRSSYLIGEPGLFRSETWRAISAYVSNFLIATLAMAPLLDCSRVLRS